MRKKLPFLIGLVIGVSIIVISAYFYFFTEKAIYSSSETAIDTPSTSVTRTITFKENESPHNVYLEVKYDINNTQDEIRLLSYNAILTDVRGEIVEKKSSSLNHIKTQTNNTQESNAKEKRTINLFKLKTLPSGNYALSLEIIPEQDLSDSVKLNSFSYAVKSESVDLNPILPLSGIVITIISLYLLVRKNKSLVNSKK